MASPSRQVVSPAPAPCAPAFGQAPETIGYYLRDENCNILEITVDQIPLVNTTIPTPTEVALLADDFIDKGAGEEMNESLLHFCRLRPHILEGVHFVMSRQVLSCVASGSISKIGKVQAIKKNGVVYVAKYQEKRGHFQPSNNPDRLRAQGTAFWGAFAVDKENSEGPFYKGVFLKNFKLSDRSVVRVLYTGELDGRDNLNRHVEVKSTKQDLKLWIEIQGNSALWQCYFGLVEHLVIGHKHQEYLDSDVMVIDEVWNSENTQELKELLFSKSEIVLGERRIGGFLKALTENLEKEKYKDEVVMKMVNGDWRVCEWDIVSRDFKYYLP